jgi:RNA polymerase sigma-54 factor
LLDIEEKPLSDSKTEQNNLEEAFLASPPEVSKEPSSMDGSEDPKASIDELNTSDALEKNDIPEELNIDTTWEESYSAGVSNTGAVSSPADDFTYQGETSDSIQDHLFWQMELTPFSDTDKAVATAIIEAVDDAGYLTVSPEDILHSVGIEDLELDEVQAVLKRIHMFDPIGVAACSIADCLLIQLNQFSADTPFFKRK